MKVSKLREPFQQQPDFYLLPNCSTFGVSTLLENKSRGI